MSQARTIAIETFVKDNLDIAKAKLRMMRMSADGGKFELGRMDNLTIKTGSVYKRASFIAGESLIIKSAYVGKKGDPILTFTSPTRDVDQVEIKLLNALGMIEGLADALEVAFGQSIGEMTQHNKEVEERRLTKERDDLIRKAQEAQAAKAARYAGKPFGAW